jgi:hypothetical protein
MDWKDIGSTIIKAGAPLLGGAIGGPAGAYIAGMVASRFGLDTDSTPGQILTAITGDPDAALKLREIEATHTERLQELENERLRIETTDVQNARLNHQHHWMPSVLTLSLMVMFACAFNALLFMVLPDGNRDMVNFMLGQLSGWLSGAVVYWVGSTRASANKDVMRR